MTPHQKQVMMFSATLSKEVRPVCKKFMHNVSVGGQTISRHRVKPPAGTLTNPPLLVWLSMSEDKQHFITVSFWGL